jgi:lactoylglutathione lyase
MSYKLFVVRVWVSDWQRAVEFYGKTLEIPFTFCDDEMGWAQLDTGECNLALERMDPADPEATHLLGRYVGVSLQVPDIQKTYERLRERGVEFAGPPAQQPWGGTLAHLKDPDGNTLTLLGTS